MAPAPPEGEADVTLTTSAKQEVMAWKLDEDEGEVRLVAVSEGKQATEEACAARHRERPRTSTNPAPPEAMVGRLRERHRAVSAQYEVDVEKREGPNAPVCMGRGTPGSYLLRAMWPGARSRSCGPTGG